MSSNHVGMIGGVCMKPMIILDGSGKSHEFAVVGRLSMIRLEVRGDANSLSWFPALDLFGSWYVRLGSTGKTALPRWPSLSDHNRV